MKKKIENNKYHYTYKITNSVNNKIYYGKHSTNNLEDNYFGGGGLAFQYALKKYGIKNFKFDIDKIFNTSEEAFEYEKKIVNEDFVNKNSTYNAKTGGGEHNKQIHKKQDRKGSILVKISAESGETLRIYANRWGHSMKWILDKLVKENCEVKTYGKKLFTKNKE